MKPLTTAITATALALGAGALTPIAAYASAPKPKLTLTAPAQMKVGVPATFKVKAKRVPRATKLVLQKKAGRKWVQVKKLGRRGGVARVTTTAGTWKFRAAVLKRGKVIAKSRTITVRATPVVPPVYTVPLSTLCQQANVTGTCGTGLLRVGSQDFRFQAQVKVSNAWSSDGNDSRFTLRRPTSCKTLTLQVAGDEAVQQYGGTVGVAVRQAPMDQAPAGYVSADSGEVATLAVPLQQAPFYLTTTGQDGMAFLSGQATGCSTPTGVL